MRMPEQKKLGSKRWGDMARGVKKDARISFFPKRPERRRETDRPISEKVLKSRERENGGGCGDGR